jgi:hypothetical protein
MPTSRTITEKQYMELRDYSGHSWRWVNGGPLSSLVSAGLIERAPHDRSMYALTAAGSVALETFRSRYGIAA